MLLDSNYSLFDIEGLEQLGLKYHTSYIKAEPFNHIVIDNFLLQSDVDLAIKHFPQPSSDIWKNRKRGKHQYGKLGIGDASSLKNVSADLLNIINAFNAYPFLNFLEKLTGIKHLLPNPYLYGGGLHQTLNGGKLDLHTDVTYPKRIDMYRRVNVLFFLNKDWKAEYNGYLELWDKDCKNCVESIAPICNRLVVFTTDANSFHGHPVPLNTKDDSITRKSISLYYYTALPISGVQYIDKLQWREVPKVMKQ